MNSQENKNVPPGSVGSGNLSNTLDGILKDGQKESRLNGSEDRYIGHENSEDYRSLLLLDELSKNNDITQRALSRNLGVALGLVNSYIKNLVSRGLVTVSSIPRNRYKYFITPKGITEKTRLTYEHLRNYTNLYRVARHDFRRLFAELENSGFKRIVFCGSDEVSEIAFLSLKETGLELLCVLDDEKAGQKFFGMEILGLKDASTLDAERFVITSFQRGEALRQGLLDAGIGSEYLLDVSSGGWLKKITPPEEGGA